MQKPPIRSRRHRAYSWISPPRMSVRSIRSGSPGGSCTGPSGDRKIDVMPRRYAEWRQLVLHDRTSRKIAKALGRYEHVDLA